MRNIKIRSIMLYSLVIFFFSGLIFFCYELWNDGKKWVFSSVNRHLSQGTECEGKIYDRFGEILAESVDGKRVYNKDKSIRTSMLHTVGDGCIVIPTSIQSKYGADLFGYNIVTGLGGPNFLKTTKNIKLTLDSGLCGKISSCFKNKKGTAVAYNYLNGEMLCMVSLPTYDIDNKPSAKLLSEEEYEGVYLNRAISASYTPGSVFKIFTTAAALDLIENVEKRVFKCDKLKLVDGEKVTCMNKHGNISLKDGFCKSCDIVFCDLALELGKEKMNQKLEEWGFNKQLYFNGIKLSKSEYSVKDATQGDLGWSGIGQYKDTLNPIHMLKIMGAIANEGTCIEPYFVKSIDSEESNNINSGENIKSTVYMGISTANKLKEMMRYTVKNQYGESKFPNMCAKTGTAEVGKDKLPHGWMVGFSYDKQFPIAFVVVVENGDFGIKSAGPIVSEMIKDLKLGFKNNRYM